jgi:putative photosynthetic complex assembly protein
MNGARNATDGSAGNSGLPRPVRRATILLAALAIGTAALSRWTGAGHVTLPGVTPVAARPIVFLDRDDGGVAALDPASRDTVATFAPGTNGFARGALRALARQRRLAGIGSEEAIVLTRWSDGRLTLEDSTTGNQVELGAFGASNAAVFAALLR